jgi:hypothetical protein
MAPVKNYLKELRTITMNSYVIFIYFYAIGPPPNMSPIFIVAPNKYYVRGWSDATLSCHNNSDGGAGHGWVHSDCDGLVIWMGELH